MTKQKIAVSERHASMSAADLAELGLSPIPVRAREKRPVEGGWQNAPIDAEAADRHIARGGNLGLRMGPQPDGRCLVAIDDDEPGAIAAAEAELGALPATLTNRTAHGHHRIFEWPADRAMPANAVRVRRGIDVRSAGGQIVVAPSVHPSGHRYEWANIADPVALPDAWVEALATRTAREKPAPGSAPSPAPGNRVARVIGIVYPHYAAGGRHALTRALGSWLYEAGFEDSEIRAVVEALPSDQTPKRVRDALDAVAQKREGAISTIGWNELAGRLGDDAARLERAVETSFGRRARERQAKAQRELAENDNDPGAKLGTAGTDTTLLGPAVDLSTPIQKLRYLCEGLGIAFDGKCAAVHGYAGSSKGLFMSLIALCVASGKPVFGVHPVTRVPVVYGDAETGVLAEIRLKRLALALGIDLGGLMRDGWFRFHRLTHQLTDVMGDLEAACRAADKGEGCAVALDSYSSLVAGDENKSEYADPMWELGRMGSRVNAVPIVTMHERKGDRDAKGGKPNPLEGISGTNRLAAALATSIRLTPSEADDKVITVTCTRAPETRFAPIELTWADEGQGLAARTARKTILTQAEIAERKAVEKQDTQARALAERIATAERAIVFRLACAELPPDASVPQHMRPERPLTASQLAKAAGVHPSRQGDGDAPAILRRLVVEGWLKLVEGGRFDAYQLAASPPTEPRRWGKAGEPSNKFDGDGRHRGLIAEIARGRAVGART
jgi:hypothetical protein